MSSFQQRMGALRGRMASCSTAPGARGAPQDPRRNPAALRRARAELQQRMATERDRVATSDPALADARSLAQQTLSRREQLKGLKDQFRDLGSQFQKALSVRSCKESKQKLIAESISNTTALIEQLNNSVIDLRNKRNKHAAVVADQLQDLESLEAKINEYATWQEDIKEAILWYDKFLGLRFVGGEGVKVVFNRIDPQHPEKEYSFCIKIDNDRYNSVSQCDPPINEFEELVKDLNLSDDLFKFVRLVREGFQASSVNGTPVRPVVCPGLPPVPFSSPVMASVKGRSEDAPNQSDSRSKNKRQSLPAKRRATALPIASPGSLRRSPRLERMR